VTLSSKAARILDIRKVKQILGLVKGFVREGQVGWENEETLVKRAMIESTLRMLTSSDGLMFREIMEMFFLNIGVEGQPAI